MMKAAGVLTFFMLSRVFANLELIRTGFETDGPGGTLSFAASPATIRRSGLKEDVYV
jgi:hypothetical protein